MSDDKIGNYRLFDEIGHGGMGVLYKAEQTNLGRFVALKVVHPYLTGDPVVMKRFNHEARAAALLNHPNIVQIYDVGIDEDQHYIAMEFVPGKTLAAVLENKGRLSPEETLRIADQVAAALGAAHDVGIVHRDIKPSNILIDDHGRVKVTDFGIAVAAGQGDLTDEGHLVGTAKYMSPEHARGEDLDGRSDLYALGIVMYEMLTGAPPFDPDDETGPLAVLEQHVNEPVPPLEGVPPATAALVMRCLEKRRVDRPRTALEFRKLLREAAGEIDWQGPSLVTLEAGADEYEHDPSFRFDHAGVVRSMTDRMAYPLAGRLYGAKGLRGRIGRKIVGWLNWRVRHERDSCKAKRLEVMELRETLARAETQLEQAKRDCDRAHEKYETADAELHEWQMSGSLVVEKSRQLSRESAAVQEKKLWQQLTSYKLQWQNLQDRVRDWYANVDRLRRDFDAAGKELELLETRRRRVARRSGATLRNRLRFVLTVAVLGAVAAGVVFHDTLFPRTAARVAASAPARMVDTQPMTCPRDEHAAALLDAEHVLVAGGYDPATKGGLASSELFSLATREFREMAPLARARFNHTMTSLDDDRVLVIGGQQKAGNDPDALASVELFYRGRFAEVGQLRGARRRHCATRLAAGTVLVTGGEDEYQRTRSDAEVYDPRTNTSVVVPMNAARKDHSAALMSDGRVVVVGGDRAGSEASASVEIYDPKTNRFDNVCLLQQARYDLTATPIDNHRVLIVGGRTGTSLAEALDTIELVDLETKTSTTIGRLRMPRRMHTATLLKNVTPPTVLIVGGAVGEAGQRNVCELFSPDWPRDEGRTLPDTRTEGPLQLTTDRNNQTATAFPDGCILFTGGYGQSVRSLRLATAELYLPSGSIVP